MPVNTGYEQHDVHVVDGAIAVDVCDRLTAESARRLASSLVLAVLRGRTSGQGQVERHQLAAAVADRAGGSARRGRTMSVKTNGRPAVTTAVATATARAADQGGRQKRTGRAAAARAVGERLSIDQLGDTVASHYKEVGVRPHTINLLVRVIEILKKDGVRYVHELADDDIRKRFKAAIGNKQIGGNYFHSLFYMLQTVRNHAARLGFLAIPPKILYRSLSLSASDIERLLDYLRNRAKDDWNDHQLYAMVVIIIFAGLTLSEVLNLRVEDIDWDSCMIHVPRSKRTAKAFPLVVPMSAYVAKVIAVWLKRRCESEWLFHRTRSFESLNHADVCRWLQLAGLAAGIPEVGFERYDAFTLSSSRNNCAFLTRNSTRGTAYAPL